MLGGFARLSAWYWMCGNTTWRTTLYEWILNHKVLCTQCQICRLHVISWVWFCDFAGKIVFKNVQKVSGWLKSMLQTGSSPSSATSATSAAMQHCRYAGRGRDCSVEIIGKIAKYGEVGVCSSADSSIFYFKSHGRPRKCRWKHHWNKMKPGLWHSCLTPRLHLKHKGCSLERQEFIELCVCVRLQSGKTIWANMFSICRIHSTSNCCRHWLGSRETWRSPQLLQYSLRHVDFNQEVPSLLSILFYCFCLEARNCSCRVWYFRCWGDLQGFLLGIGCVATLLDGLRFTNVF